MSPKRILILFFLFALFSQTLSSWLPADFIEFLPETQTAYAAQIKETHRAKIVLGAEELEDTLSLEAPVDPRKSFLVVTALTEPLAPGISNAAHMVSFETFLADSAVLKARRSVSGVEAEVHVNVVEFDSGVIVYHGATVFGPDTYMKKIKLPDLDREHSFPLLTAVPVDSGLTAGAHGFFKASFADSATLRIERSEAARLRFVDEETGKSSFTVEPMPEMRVSWQVIEMQDVRIQSGIAKIPHFGADTNAYLLEPVENIDRALLLFQYTAGLHTGGREALTRVRGEFSEKDELTFQRGIPGEDAGDELEINWYVLEFVNDSGMTQRGNVHFAASEHIKLVPLSSIDPSRAVPFVDAVVHAPEELDKEILKSDMLFAARIVDRETLEISRSAYSSGEVAADVSWQIVEFPQITIQEPSEGSTWKIGETRNIAWGYSNSALAGGRGEEGIHLLNIHASLDAGADNYPYLIAWDVPVTAEQYPWTLPERFGTESPAGKSMRIRITDRDEDLWPSQVSPVFHAKGTLTLVAPNGSEVWEAGTEHREILWKYKGDIEAVSIYYDAESAFGEDAFPKENKIATVAPGEDGTGYLKWGIPPELHSHRMKIKIVQTSDPEVYDISENDFSVVPVIEILNPDQGTERWSAGIHQMVRWKTSGMIKNFNLYYTQGKSEDWVPAALNIPGAAGEEHGFRWLVPKEAVGEPIRLKLEKAGDPSVFDTAPDQGDLGISVVSWVRLILPEPGGVLWKVGDGEEIKWEHGGTPEYLRLEYSRNGGKKWEEIAYVSAEQGSYRWTVPDDIGKDFRLRLLSIKNPEIQDVYQGPVEIRGHLELLEPKEGETWYRGKNPGEVTWSSSGSLGTVSILMDTESGKGGYPGEKTLGGGIAHETGRFVVDPIPDISSFQVRLKIVQDNDPETYDESAGDFTIIPLIQGLEPNAANGRLLAGTPAAIRWDSTGTVGSFELSYAVSPEGPWQAVDSDIPGGPAGSYSYNWTVPVPLIGNSLYFKAGSAKESRIASEVWPAAGIPVESWIRLSLPAGTKIYPFGEKIPLTWEASSDVTIMRIQHSVDGGKTWVDDAVVKGAEKQFQWPMPRSESGTVLIRISDLNRAEVSTDSEMIRTA